MIRFVLSVPHTPGAGSKLDNDPTLPLFCGGGVLYASGQHTWKKDIMVKSTATVNEIVQYYVWLLTVATLTRA